MRRTPPAAGAFADPDARLVRWGWIAWGVLTAYLGARWIALDGAGAADAWTWLQIAPALGLWALWLLARGGVTLWHWLRAAPLAACNGSYFEFDGRQVRVLFDEDDIYLVADDVFAALGLPASATAAARVRLAAGRDGLRKLAQWRELVLTERGLGAWLERRSDPKAARFRRWFEHEVAAPYRRRRQR